MLSPSWAVLRLTWIVVLATDLGTGVNGGPYAVLAPRKQWYDYLSYCADREERDDAGATRARRPGVRRSGAGADGQPAALAPGAVQPRHR